MSKTPIILLIVLLVAGGTFYWLYQSGAGRGANTQEQACLDSGGTVVVMSCCLGSGDFPNLCAIGACGCSLDNSKEIRACDCGENRCFNGEECTAIVSTFSECVDAGYTVSETTPKECQSAQGRTFIEGEEACLAPTGEALTLFQAKEIAENSECGMDTKEPYYRFALCNANTGTWWIDMTLEKEGCSPACVVDIVEQTAEINWRCAGLIEE